ncbi:MAG: multifunctional CCA addition/repair protein [Gammaproteobacteria bacterium]|nr:multifunctional CCA addition/repair protein [Gammaproteobacteria bacterium]MBU1553234.1 multifunctional CCA addition/repair protein [Gammaproteobacteria bacterium]MBU2069027.1 multifunctional CCA addition/repair protein [Gammaproteobacteria bacterium]MBU2183250.1 multifunctional CCA addition/repair protein [Gammaproteobacteria bacterium]MBU2204629.1 multifunctional CCA addition/repair protein [Gammaproteobacteria bacterium]
MQRYLVGGAVRDSLLGYPFHERDWVVVGATPQQMLDAGYQQVGKDFPVFLHPQTKEEHALARTERKSGRGYTGFSVYAAPDVTLEQDLLRRDLTINAIAQADDGSLVDPFGGAADIANKILRHVSEAFAEDPLRVLRVARFYARYAHLGFSVAPETQALMRQLSDELNTITPERVWQETAKALSEQTPQAYFQLLHDTGALAALMPELDTLWGVPQPPQWHPEIDTGVHTLLVLQQAAALSPRLDIRFAALVHDLGKGVTKPELWPSHHGHEHTGLPLINQLCDSLRVPNDCRELALLVCEYHQLVHRARELKSSTVLKLFNAIDVWRKPERLEAILLSCTADLRGRTGFEQAAYPQADYLQKLADAARQVTAKDLVAQGLKGEAIKQGLHLARLAAIKAAQQQEPTT